MHNHYVGEGYDIASLLCPILFHVRRNKICLNQNVRMDRKKFYGDVWVGKRNKQLNFGGGLGLLREVNEHR